MKRSVIFTLFLLFALAFPSSTLEKPWNDYRWMRNNSYIITLGSVGFWDVNSFDLTLQGLGLDAVASREYPAGAGRVEAALRQAQQSRQESIRQKDRCDQEIVIALLLHTGETLAYPESSALAIFFNLLEFQTPFKPDEVRDCIDYGSSWRATMDASAHAVEESLQMVEKEQANDSLATVLNAGICEDRYPGTARTDCPGLQGQQQAVEQQQIGLGGALQRLKTENRRMLPDGRAFNDVMRGVWAEDGLLPRLQALHDASARTLQKADQEYAALAMENEQQVRDADVQIRQLQEQRPDLIASSPFVFGTVETGQERGVSAAFEEVQGRKREADERLLQARAIYARRLPGYLKNATLLRYEAREMYQEIARRSAQIEGDAERTKEQMRDESQHVMDDLRSARQHGAIGPEAENQLREAQIQWDAGESATATGVAYQHYREAAKAARIGLASAQGYSVEEEAQQRSYEQGLADLLARARTDGLDVHLEEAEFRLARGRNEVWAVNLLESAEQSVLEKARISFGYLESRRAEVRHLLSVSPEFDDIERELARKEGNAFLPNGKINYPSALGGLQGLDAAYALAESQALGQTDVIVREELEKSVIHQIDPARLDAPSTLSVSVYLYNPTPFSVEQMALQLPLPHIFELSDSDITAGAAYASGIAQSGDTLTLNLRNVTAGGRYSIRFAKDKILAHTHRYHIEATGNPDGSADIQERREFTLDYEDTLDLDPNDRTRTEERTIDGTAYRSRTLAAGAHQLEIRSTEPDAFTQSEDGYRSSDLGITTRVEYDVYIRPRIDLDRAELLLPQNNDSIRQFRLLSVTGEDIENKRFLGNGMYAFELTRLRANRTAQVHASLDITDAQGYAERQLQLLSADASVSGAAVSGEPSDAVRTLLDDARALLAQNQSGEALARIEEARNVLEREERDVRKEEQAYAQLREERQQELEGIADTLAQLDLLNGSRAGSDPFVQKLEIRKELLETALEEMPNESTAQRIARLQELDPRWQKKEIAQLIRDAQEEYRDLKEELLGVDNATPVAEDVADGLQRLQVSQSLADTIPLLDRLDALRSLSDQNALMQDARQNASRQALQEKKARLEEKLTAYAAQRKEAQGTSFETAFRIDPSTVEKTLRDAEQAIKKGEWDTLSGQLDLLDRDAQAIDGTWAYLQNETERKLRNAERIYSDREASLSPEEKQRLNDQLTHMRSLANQGQYIQALKTYDGFLKGLPGTQQEETPLLILGVTVALILALFIAYLLQQMRGKPSDKPFSPLSRLGSNGQKKPPADPPTAFKPLPRADVEE